MRSTCKVALSFVPFLVGQEKEAFFFIKDEKKCFLCTFLFERKVPKEATSMLLDCRRKRYMNPDRLPGRILHEQVRVVARGGAREHPRNHADENRYRFFHGVSSNRIGRSPVPMIDFRCPLRKVSRLCAPIRVHGSSRGLMPIGARLINPSMKLFSQTCRR